MANVIDRAFVISLKDRKERWDKFDQLNDPRVSLVPALDTRTIKRAESALDKNKFYLNPPGGVYSDYFSTCCGSIGCFLTHYKIWKNIVKEKIPYTLIIEDDAEIEDVTKVLYVDTERYRAFLGPVDTHIMQLNYRTIEQSDYTHVFSGTESYILNLEGAKRLIYLANNNELFHNEIKHPTNKNTPPNKKYISFRYTRKGRCIWAPVDRFIGVCNNAILSEDLRVTIKIKQRVGLMNPLERSDIFNPDVEMPHWLISEEEVKDLRKTESYKWWSK